MTDRKIRLILASGSPRRRELMEQAGLQCEIITSRIQEKTAKTRPEDIVMDLSRQKAEAVYSKLPVVDTDVPYYVVIGADTIVSCDGTVLGKPRDREDEINMLRLLQGRSHHVFTGVSILSETESSVFYCDTEVFLTPISDREIEIYADSSEPYDKAGGYAIQGRFGVFVSEIRGDYNNVVGLPVSRLYHELKRMRLLDPQLT